MVPLGAAESILKRSGIVTDIVIRTMLRGDEKRSKDHAVLWVDGDWSKARELHRQAEGACGLVYGQRRPVSIELLALLPLGRRQGWLC